MDRPSNDHAQGACVCCRERLHAVLSRGWLLPRRMSAITLALPELPQNAKAGPDAQADAQVLHMLAQGQPEPEPEPELEPEPEPEPEPDIYDAASAFTI